MTKQLIAIAIAATFGVAHAADVKAATEVKPAAAPTAAVVKAEAPKAEVKAPEAKVATAAPEAKAEAKVAEQKPVKHAKHVKTAEPKAADAAKVEVPKTEPAKAAEPMKK